MTIAKIEFEASKDNMEAAKDRLDKATKTMLELGIAERAATKKTNKTQWILSRIEMAGEAGIRGAELHKQAQFEDMNIGYAYLYSVLHRLNGNKIKALGGGMFAKV